MKTRYCNWCNLALGEQEVHYEDGRGVHFHLSCHVIYLENKGRKLLDIVRSSAGICSED